jgi:flavin reductase (DIM6/NTAB) family NADH-FMN oxidoreductase RutF
MAKVEVPYDCHIGPLLQLLQKPGALLVSRDEDGRPNPMTIGWAQVGIIWGRKIMSVMVRPSRYTYRCMELTRDFTLCAPYMSQAKSVVFCGTQSGRDFDKFAECGFTPLPSETVTTPGIAECGLVYECKVVNYADFSPEHLLPQVNEDCYSSGDYHRVYFGEIMRVVADEDLHLKLGG